jgi:hypothetical protein
MRAIALLLPFFALMLAGSGVLAAWELKHLQRDDVEVVLAAFTHDSNTSVNGGVIPITATHVVARLRRPLSGRRVLISRRVFGSPDSDVALAPSLDELAVVASEDPGALARLFSGQSALADDVAQQDARMACDGATLARDALRELPPHRARNLLRWFLHARGRMPPSTARLADMLVQLATARDDAQVRIAHDGVELGVHRGRIHVHAPPPPPFAVRWAGEPSLALPHGTLRFDLCAQAAGPGAIAASRIAAGARSRLSCRRRSSRRGSVGRCRSCSRASRWSPCRGSAWPSPGKPCGEPLGTP